MIGVERWLKEDDERLIAAVAIHGSVDMWKTIALSVPGRTNKACRKRWLHSLSPSIKKTAWGPLEDQRLIDLYALHGPKWSIIAREIPGRTDDACSKRYRESLDPSLKNEPWTAHEDARLTEAYMRLGGKWAKIGQELSRSGLGCRNRWRLLDRKRSQQRPQSLTDQSFAVPYFPDYTQLDYFVDSMQLPEVVRERPVFEYASSSLNAALPQLSSGSGWLSTETTTASGSQISWESSRHSSVEIPNAQVNNVEANDVEANNVEMGSVEVPQPDSWNVGPDAPDDLTGQWEDQSMHVPSSPSSSYLESPVNSPHTRSVSPPPPPGQSTDLQLDVSTTEPVTQPPPRQIRGEARRRQREAEGLFRLSANLPIAADLSVQPYACGHIQCWPLSATTSNAKFATSQELVDHSKLAHKELRSAMDRPFRCGLEGCGKSWKNINGLQYHLQISMAHFQKAVSDQILTATVGYTPASPTSGRRADGKKTFGCDLPGCSKVYRQLSGLRYHRLHGHPESVPVQLDSVPPTLVREMAIKAVRKKKT